jgi:CrcB protein
VTLALLVSIAAGLGAVARYLLDTVIQHRHRGTFPLGTLTINLVGSFVLGLVTGLATHHGLSSRTTIVAGVGFCGGFTTFSTWMWESLVLAQNRALRAATLNTFGSMLLGLAAAGAGLGLARL